MMGLVISKILPIWMQELIIFYRRQKATSESTCEAELTHS